MLCVFIRSLIMLGESTWCCTWVLSFILFFLSRASSSSSLSSFFSVKYMDKQWDAPQMVSILAIKLSNRYSQESFVFENHFKRLELISYLLKQFHKLIVWRYVYFNGVEKILWAIHAFGLLHVKTFNSLKSLKMRQFCAYLFLPLRNRPFKFRRWFVAGPIRFDSTYTRPFLWSTIWSQSSEMKC